MLVTKCDLLGGFNETFGNLGREEREQVWGFTMPYDDAAAAGGGSPVQAFAAEFDALEQRLREQLVDRLQAETDVLHRAAIFAFPPQFAGMKGLLGSFLDQVFAGGGGLEEQAVVRGVYFTSGTQEGSPIDRVLGTLGRTFGVDSRSAAPDQAGARQGVLPDAAAQGGGVPRAGAGRRQPPRRVAPAGASRDGRGGRRGGRARRRQRVDDQLPAQQVLPRRGAGAPARPEDRRGGAAAGHGRGDVRGCRQVLDRAATLPDPTGYTIPEPPLLNTLGLYEGEYVAAGADIAYRRLLDKALLPRVTRRIEERLRAVNRDNLELAYESLKHYLMLYTPEHFDAQSLAAFVGLDWDANLARTFTPEQRQALVRHLDAAFARGAPPPAAPMDAALVANVRDMLAVYPLEFRIFSRLQRSRVGADIPDFTVAGAAGPNALRVFERASGEPLTKGIPGLFTKDGYFKAFRTAQARVTKGLAEEEAWVMGRRPAAGASGRGRRADGRRRPGRDDERARAEGPAPVPAGVHQGLGPLHRRRAAHAPRRPGHQQGRRRAAGRARLSAQGLPARRRARDAAGGRRQRSREHQDRRRGRGRAGGARQAGDGSPARRAAGRGPTTGAAGGRSRRWSTTTSRRCTASWRGSRRRSTTC